MKFGMSQAQAEKWAGLLPNGEAHDMSNVGCRHEGFEVTAEIKRPGDFFPRTLEFCFVSEILEQFPDLEAACSEEDRASIAPPSEPTTPPTPPPTPPKPLASHLPSKPPTPPSPKPPTPFNRTAPPHL